MEKRLNSNYNNPIIRKMKTIAFLFTGTLSPYQFEKTFDGKSAVERAVLWSQNLDSVQKTYILTVPQNESAVKDAVSAVNAQNIAVETKDFWTNAALVKSLAEKTASEKADAAVLAWGSCPFLDRELSLKVLSDHEKYLAEYTYSDGFPYGFAPEVIDAGALRIIAELAEGIQKSAGDLPVTKDAVFSIMKGDINSFEIETVIAPKDYRQLRLDFSCNEKSTYLACLALWNKVKDEKEINAESMSNIAEKSAEIQQTVPAFYNIQISSLYNSQLKYSPYFDAFKNKYGYMPVAGKNDGMQNNMNLESFKSLAAEISRFSDKATVGLSAWGEPLLNGEFISFVEEVLKYENLSVLIETDGLLVTEETAAAVKNAAEKAGSRKDGQSAVNWIVKLDAFTPQKYAVMHGIESGAEEKFTAAKNAVALLEKYFTGCVYPEMLRVNENEDELESFYRYWHEKESPSNGKLIILKYDSFCGLLPDEKPADLSPLVRNPCWHIKRDMTVLSDGSVPLCREMILDSECGNVFADGIENVWAKFKQPVCEHICNNLSEKCRACDEYYTFNF